MLYGVPVAVPVEVVNNVEVVLGDPEPVTTGEVLPAVEVVLTCVVLVVVEVSVIA